VVELGSRRRTQPAPPHVVWASLTQPHQAGARAWLDVLDDETEPQILDSSQPVFVVWSSLWPNRPAETIRFDLELAGQGTALRWTLLTAGEPPDDSAIGHMRFRLNRLINERLRLSYGQ
jgi:hypothetical protein